jgi:hypothetical protein
MPHVRLTDVSISKLPLSKCRVTYWDEGGLPGFGARVGARRKTFVLVLNCGHRIKLRQYPLISLKDARQEALIGISLPLTGIFGAFLFVTIRSSNSFAPVSCHCPPTSGVGLTFGTGPCFH